MNSNAQAALPPVAVEEGLQYKCKTLLDAVVAVGNSINVDARSYKSFTVFHRCVGTLTVAIQGLSPTGDWTTLDTRDVTIGTGSIAIQFSGPFEAVRVIVSAYTSGSITSSIAMSKV